MVIFLSSLRCWAHYMCVGRTWEISLARLRVWAVRIKRRNHAQLLGVFEKGSLRRFKVTQIKSIFYLAKRHFRESRGFSSPRKKCSLATLYECLLSGKRLIICQGEPPPARVSSTHSRSENKTHAGILDRVAQMDAGRSRGANMLPAKVKSGIFELE